MNAKALPKAAKAFVADTHARKISPLDGLSAPLGEMTKGDRPQFYILHSTFYIFVRRGARVSVLAFPPWGKVAAQPTEEGGGIIRKRAPLISSPARRHGRRRTSFAALPVAPAAPLPKKFFDTFWEPYMRAPASPEGEAENRLSPTAGQGDKAERVAYAARGGEDARPMLSPCRVQPARR